jgi:integrase
MAGVNPAYIATQLGHADTTMLFKHYAKWIKGADSGAEAAKARAAFGAGKPLELVQNWSTDNVKPITSRG